MQPLSANFTIVDGNTCSPDVSVTDTIFARMEWGVTGLVSENPILYLDALDERGANYTWIIHTKYADDTLSKVNGNRFIPYNLYSINDSLQNNDSITITLTVTGSLDACLTDPGQLTSTVTRHFIYAKRPYKWLGKFMGYNKDNPSDTFTITIGKTHTIGLWPLKPDDTTLGCYNFPKGLTSYTEITQYSSTKFKINHNFCDCCNSYFQDFGNVSVAEGIGIMTEPHTLEITYFYLEKLAGGSIIQKNKVFIGQRVY